MTDFKNKNYRYKKVLDTYNDGEPCIVLYYMGSLSNGYKWSHYNRNGELIHWLQINPNSKYAYGEEYTHDDNGKRYRYYKGDYILPKYPFDIYNNIFCSNIIQEGECEINIVCFEDANNNLCTPNSYLINENSNKRKRAAQPVRRYKWYYKGNIKNNKVQGKGKWIS